MEITRTMKNCPYCAEEIQEEAIKCKHCGEFLDGSRSVRVVANKLPWYFRTFVIVLALGSVGPLALPMIWWHPKLKPLWKVGISVGVIVITWMLYQSMVASLKMIEEDMNMLKGM